MARSGSAFQLVLVDQMHAEDLLELSASGRFDPGMATLALAYRDADVARSFLQRWYARFDTTIGFLPMNVSLEVWLSLVRLLLHGQVVLPDELVASRAALRDAPPAAKDPPPCALAPTGLRSTGLPPTGLKPLTLREQEVLELIARGESNKRIAAELDITVHTVKLHVHNLVRKLDVPNRTAAVSLYFEQQQQQGGLR
ncbi:response regulator transcription factor [Salipiger sp. PrR002]|uniref:helix-turn-helix transcriptional regulator n=1 Tax=Salipiger sp. PrR002 TaxID=2706489 RepID=UPI0013B886CE|nr:response regulator transcription factor [Salipiger sp. PrR002]NDW01136.1 response regulator transcription factor [Salipiger sp. PrR002]NDW57939.1 response regulator transcription factor [Salipiger sp. PrR004]